MHECMGETFSVFVHALTNIIPTETFLIERATLKLLDAVAHVLPSLFPYPVRITSEGELELQEELSLLPCFNESQVELAHTPVNNSYSHSPEGELRVLGLF